MRVYHQLLDACFIAGLHLENRYEWLPPMRRNMMKTQRGRGVTSRVMGFYLVPILVLELISGAAVILWLMKIHWPGLAMLTALLLMLVTVGTALTVSSKTSNTADSELQLSTGP